MPKEGVTAKPAGEGSGPVVEYWEEKRTYLLNLNPESQWPVKIGLGKCKVILANADAIQRFVENGGKPFDEEPEDDVDMS